MLILSFALACAPAPSGAGDTAADCPWAAPTNTWPVSAPTGCPQPEGFSAGEVVPDVRLPDQFGDTVALWQFSGDLLLLDFSSMWGVQMWPRELAALGAEYADAGLTTVSVIVEDQYGETADTADLQDWQAATGAVGPVLSDPEVYRSQVSSEEAWPEILVIGRDLRVLEAGLRWQEEGEIRARVEEHL